MADKFNLQTDKEQIHCEAGNLLKVDNDTRVISASGFFYPAITDTAVPDKNNSFK